MILVTGPTGSGKTSTLYTALNSIKSSTNNIITLEDPIEMQIPGVNQMQINAKAGVTFASGLRSILRQDPNVILVGEIRDQETADIALGAAQTGHLLLSTLHTNDATATITRLFDLGIQPFLIASSLLGIVAQRLVRRPCPACAVRQPPSAETIEKVGGPSRLPRRWASGWSGTGCEKCGQSRLKGRIAIHEVLAVNDEVRDLISSRARRARDQEGREARRHADAARRRHRQGGPGPDHARRSAAGGLSDDRRRRVGGQSGRRGADRVRRGGVRRGIVRPARATAPRRRHGRRPRRPRARRRRQPDDRLGREVFPRARGLRGARRRQTACVGLEMALRERPDVIVSDVNMPGMGGVAMVKALRADAAHVAASAS